MSHHIPFALLPELHSAATVKDESGGHIIGGKGAGLSGTGDTIQDLLLKTTCSKPKNPYATPLFFPLLPPSQIGSQPLDYRYSPLYLYA